MTPDVPAPLLAPAPVLPPFAPRLTLIVSSDPLNPPRIECRRAITLIGSRDRCKVCLRHPSVAPVHMAIVHNGAEIIAVDLVTSRGTLLNGLKLEHETLNDGDVLSIGSWDLRVEIKTPSHDTAAQGAVLDLEPAPQAFALEHMASHRLLQPNRKVCIIGRRKGCDIAISDPRVSRAHALLVTYLGYPAAFDLLSRNETFVNTQPVGFQILKNDDVLAIGDSKFRVRALASSVARTAASSIELAAPVPAGTESSSISLSANPRSQEAPSDMIDIKATEGSQTWTIVDSLEKATRKK